MSVVSLVRRSLRFYWRTTLGVFAGAALASGILIGALAVGDSVRHTLEQQALARIGRTQLALSAANRFFREDLATALMDDLARPVAPLLAIWGTVSKPDGTRLAANVQIVGVNDRFWQLGTGKDPFVGARADDAVANEQLTLQLGAHAGDTLVVRVEEPSYLSRDAPLSGRVDTSTAFRVHLRAIAGEAEFGRFSLQPSQIPPMTLFLPLQALQKILERPGRANALLVAGDGTQGADAALRKHWTLADANLELREIPGALELRTDRVFLEPHIAEITKSVVPGAIGVLTYLVNELRFAERATPYSMVTATEIAGLRDDEIVVNSWLADDLGAKVGDEITLKYFVIAGQRNLREESQTFRISEIKPLESPDTSWTPPFPGVSEVENCRDWEPGIPIDTSRIRPKDEDYWDEFRGTPKAFITLEAGQQMWGNRFGNLTAIRYPASQSPAEFERVLLANLDPAQAGLTFEPVRERAFAAARESMDFGQLFIGFSSFLIGAALLLMAMLFVFNLEQRSEETGLLLALGFRPAQVKRLFILEGIAVVALGTLAGVVAGVAYSKLALHGLATVWRTAVNAASFQFYVRPSTLLVGVVAGGFAAIAAIWLAALGQARRPAAELLARGAEREIAPLADWRVKLVAAVGVLSLLGALALTITSRSARDPGVFFGAGSLLLISGVAFSHTLLAAIARASRLVTTLGRVGMRGAARLPGRSLGTVAVLSSGVFMIVSVSAFRHDPHAHALERSSGTGGFALLAQATLPVYEDLNSPQAQATFGLGEQVMRNVSVVGMRVRDGDDASCLNLNRAQQPRVLAVRAEEFQRRRAFGDEWRMLDQPQADGAVPAIGDEATVRWALGKKVGDTIAYVDERGNTFHLRIVAIIPNSILQGSLVISERNFVERFPSGAGHRVLLVDAPPENSTAVADELSRALRDRGLEVIPAWRRLADFQEVENTYIAIFQALGGLGLVLGSFGLGIVVLRNVLERRSELALLEAVGFRRGELERLVLSEHWLLIMLGLAIGVAAALLAVLPALISPGTKLPWATVLPMLALLAASGGLWTWLATLVALRGELLPALRNE
jgi:ABC-type lipoprotein release transport system permease subunit